MVKFISLWVVLSTIAFMPSGVKAVEQLSLSEAIKVALQHNPEVSRANHEIDASRGRFWQGVSLPPTELTVGYNNVPVGERLKQYRERVVEIGQSFDFPTTYALRSKALATETQIAKVSFTNAQQAITEQVKVAYYTAVASQGKLKLAEENLKIAEEFLRKAEAKFKIGESTRLEKLTAGVQRTQARNAVDVSTNQLKMAMGDLYFALGREQTESTDFVKLTDSLTYRPLSDSVEVLLQTASQTNPELKASALGVKTTSMNKSLAWSSLLPSFNIGYNRVSTSGEDPNFGASIGASIPLWFMFDHRGKIQEATAIHRKAQSEYASTSNLIRSSIRNCYLELLTYDKQVLLYQSDILPQAKEVFRVAATSFEAGEISYIEYLQAKQSLIAIESEYIDVLLNVNSAMARLEKAVGKELHQ